VSLRRRRTADGLRLLGIALLGALAAAPLLGAGYPLALRIPKAKPRPPGALEAALFSHGTHAQYRCYACHPQIFPQAAEAFTHADMDAGRFCARCHDGQQARAVRALPCESCHVPR
jgi:c(7)-type cytochrome triheme protein